MKSHLLTLHLLISISAQAQLPSLDFLGRAESDTVWVLDSGYDPTPLIGELNPPYDVGNNQLTGVSLATGEITAEVLLGDSAPVLAFDVSPNGDQALALRIGANALISVTGLSNPQSATLAEVSLPLQPLSLAFSLDGRRAAIGYQTGAGEAMVSLVDLAPGAGLVVHPPVGLGVEADVLTAVEGVAFTMDGSRLVTQTGLHDVAPPSAGFFTPRIALQSSAITRQSLAAGSALFPDRESALPPTAPFQDLPTGVALGDFALACDGNSLVLPVSGALDLGQPDARIMIVEGVSTGILAVGQTLTPADGVNVGPLQVELAADCDRALVVNAFSGTVTEISGLLTGALSLVNAPLLSPFPSEPAITADLGRLAVLHARPPLDGVPPSNVTVYDLATLEDVLGPVFGPVRPWLQAKDRTMATWPPGLLDRIAAFDIPGWSRRMLERPITRAINAAGKNQEWRTRFLLLRLLKRTRWLQTRDHLSDLQAAVIEHHIRHALQATRRDPESTLLDGGAH